MSMLTYRGYTAKVDVDVDDDILVGRILGINDVIGFHADDPKSIRAAFQEAVDDYLDTCAKVGKEPDKAYSGKMLFRVDPALHRSAAIAAAAADQSLNEWGEAVLRKAVEG
ncbi:type II toxin-antitoxin system HicB family antitoxin [Jiella sp. M17.18]|uniref:type II toxin-antitoxin system HicB family antitoxin n=1 Tax=Jiella sp. M17.18 TaxID=3234247 RepID=UPI0034DF3350